MACSFGAVLRGDPDHVEKGLLTSYKPEVVTLAEPVLMELKGIKDRSEITRYFSQSYTKTYESEELVHEKTEIVDFTVRTKTVSVDETNSVFTNQTEVIYKDGPVDLHDLAFPESGENLNTIYSRSGKVVLAGAYPRDSIFYVPPIALPNKPVTVGDTWINKFHWVSLKNGIPMELELTSILKNAYKCQEKGVCLEVELSGEVRVSEDIAKGLQLSSLVSGRLLFATETGTVLWSDVRNKEKFSSGAVTLDVQSCMESLLDQPEKERWLWRQQPKCDATQPLPAVPGT